MATDKTLTALLIIHDKKPDTALAFAKMLWPDSDMHRQMYSAGAHGSRRGCGSLTGGSFLSKLEKRGLIQKHFRPSASHRVSGIASLTAKGEEYIRNESQKG